MFENYKNHIPEHMMFTGEIPGEAAVAAVLEKLEVEEKDNSLTPFQLARLGKITASCFGKIAKVRTGGWGETALSYLYDVVGEHLTGQPAENFTGNKATEWGNFYEADALRAYTKRTGRKIKSGTYYNHPELEWVGGTPDGLVGERGVIEAKCPLTFKNHLRTVITRTVPDEYLPQVIGHLWLSGRDWCDFISYDPRIEGRHRLAIIRVNRNDHHENIAALGERITEFHGLMLEKLAALNIKPGWKIPKRQG